MNAFQLRKIQPTEGDCCMCGKHGKHEWLDLDFEELYCSLECREHGRSAEIYLRAWLDAPECINSLVCIAKPHDREFWNSPKPPARRKW